MCQANDERRIILDGLVSSTASPAGFADVLLRMGLAAIAGAVIGLDREQSQRAAGLRTNMLVSLAACLFTLTALRLAFMADAAGDAARADPIRVIEAVTAGVAFIAAGSVIRARHTVRGVTTAAALWLAGAAGVACGVGAFDLAGAAVALAVIILVAIGWFEDQVFKPDPRSDPDNSGER